MAPPRDDNDDGNNANPPKRESPGWFDGWFRNNDDHSRMREEIHQKLNRFEEDQKRYEDQRKQQQEAFFGGAGGGFPDVADFWKQALEDLSGDLHGHGRHQHQQPHRHMSSTTVSTNSYRMRQDSRFGAKVTANLPRGTQQEGVEVEVLREHPCVVQWRGTAKGGRPFRERVRLGEAVDCSRLSVSLSQARNVLEIEAPNHPPPDASRARRIPVAEHDHDDEGF